MWLKKKINFNQLNGGVKSAVKDCPIYGKK